VNQLKFKTLGNYTSVKSNPVDLMSYSFVNFVTILISIERKCHIYYIIMLNKLTLTQSKCISVILEEFMEYANNQ
jgi:hypothetical protein